MNQDVIELIDKRESNSDLPWLVFRLHDLTYTINSRIVTSIAQIPEEVTPVTSAPDTFRGIINYRGEILPLLDMRRYFSLVSFLDEQKKLQEMLDARYKEHLEWVNMLKQSILKRENFPGKLDPTECKFGKFIYSHQTVHGNQTVNMSTGLKKIIQPHEEFHKLGITILNKTKNLNKEQRELFIENSEEFNKLKKCVSEIKKRLDEIVENSIATQREMVVVIDDGKTQMGIVVDEVVAVDFLSIVSDESKFPRFQNENIFTGVAHSTKINDEILLVNEELLLNEVEKIKR